MPLMRSQQQSARFQTVTRDGLGGARTTCHHGLASLSHVRRRETPAHAVAVADVGCRAVTRRRLVAVPPLARAATLFLLMQWFVPDKVLALLAPKRQSCPTAGR